MWVYITFCRKIIASLEFFYIEPIYIPVVHFVMKLLESVKWTRKALMMAIHIISMCCIFTVCLWFRLSLCMCACWVWRQNKQKNNCICHLAIENEGIIYVVSSSRITYKYRLINRPVGIYIHISCLLYVCSQRVEVFPMPFCGSGVRNHCLSLELKKLTTLCKWHSISKWHNILGRAMCAW